jgi:hypothetical protein
MQAEVRCSYCNNDFKVDYIEDDLKLHGKNAKCPFCQNVLWIYIGEKIMAEPPMVLIDLRKSGLLEKGGGRIIKCDEI